MKRDVAIVGAGYVGVPLAQVFADAGRSVLLVDVDAERVAQLNRGESYIEDVPSDELARLVDDGRDRAPRTDYDELRDADAILIALPTPLSRQREPDLSIVRPRRARDRDAAAAGPPRRARVDHVPGHDARAACSPCSRRAAGLKAGVDFHLAFSPERVDPGRTDWTTKNVPKVVGGINDAPRPRRRRRSTAARSTRVHRVSSPEAAELTKLLENIFRSVNIALVNELAQLCDRMGIDVWEVVDAAATKPFGFMRFEPGPGPRRPLHPDRPLLPHLEGARVRLHTEFIELAGKVNENMPYYCRSLVSQALNHGAASRCQRLADPRARRRVQGRHLRHARVARR